VTDVHSKGTDTRRRFRAALRWLAGVILVSIVGSWLFLYIDSVYQRRRAESLFADLRSLDFATAGFPEVRDIVIRNGGHVGSTCNPQNCTFSLQIMTLLPRIMTRQTRIQLLDRHPEFFYRTLSYIGVRSWNLRAIFEIRNGKLEGSFTGVFEIRMESLDSSGNRYFVPRPGETRPALSTARAAVRTTRCGLVTAALSFPKKRSQLALCSPPRYP
jgi:hypothetical protein